MKARRKRLTVGTMNLSYGAVKRNPWLVALGLAWLLLRCHVVAIQEAGAAEAVVRRAARVTGRVVWWGNGEPGQASTPIVVRRRGHRRWRAWRLTGHRQLDPRGAGPSWAKPKWLMAARVAGGYVGCVHLTPSTQYELNRQAVREQVRGIVDAVRLATFPGGWWVAGDFNQEPDSQLMEPLREVAGLRSAQGTLGPISTHGHRTIDDVWFNPDHARPVKHRTVKVPGDHRGYRVVFELVEHAA